MNNLDQSWALCLTGLPVEGNIAQSCQATLLKKLHRVSSALKHGSLRITHSLSQGTEVRLATGAFTIEWSLPLC